MKLYITPGGRLYSPELGRFLSRDPLDRQGQDVGKPYAYVLDNPVGFVDPMGYGPCAVHISRIEEALANNQEQVAAQEAFFLYKFMAIGGAVGVKVPLAPYPHAREFMGRWLKKEGGTRKLSKSECQSLLTEKGVNSRWGMDVGDLKNGQLLQDHAFGPLMATEKTDWFYAMGYFTVRFTGCVKRDGNTVTLNGKFKISDKYDWQDCGEKYVELFGDRIYDKYAKLVEDTGRAKAFDIEGEYDGIISLELGVAPKPIDGNRGER